MSITISYVSEACNIPCLEYWLDLLRPVSNLLRAQHINASTRLQFYTSLLSRVPCKEKGKARAKPLLPSVCSFLIRPAFTYGTALECSSV
mmetsp:Transcript_32374/g.83951  ORF Transcript_32374/g.83951 Transcript_32374/m.83951 type:complete len:90 (-) Transcript_32374:370-639(-)